VDCLTPPPHGGDLRAASERYGIPPSDWLDLSTGINPRAYPIKNIDTVGFRQLPSDIATLYSTVKNYCSAPANPVAAAGSQTLIQWLPQLRWHCAKKAARVAVPSIGYAEHAFRWQWGGHQIFYYDPRRTHSIDELLQREAIDVLVIINPHNPLALVIEPTRLLQWREIIAARDGWIIVDESFIDATPQHSVAKYTNREALIVLRSFGKFFGLPGVRCGFAFCHEVMAAPLRVAIGPWPLSSTAIQIAEHAYRDHEWQQKMRGELFSMSKANASLLRERFAGEPALMMTGVLFNSFFLPTWRAIEIAEELGRAAILVRNIVLDHDIALLRLGLVDPEKRDDWRRLVAALNCAK
jgi:cobalamin biosynthetic protein CobC